MDTPGLRAALKGLGCDALLVVASSSEDPDLAVFAAGGRLGEALVVVGADGNARLGFFNSMERGEASLSGLRVLDPIALGVDAADRVPLSGQERWSRALTRAVDSVSTAGRRVALAGQLPAGLLLAVVGSLRRSGWSFVDGGRVLAAMRRKKNAIDLETIRVVAEGTCEAFRRVARVLALAKPRRGVLWFEGSRLTVGALRAEIGLSLAGLGLTQPEGNLVAPAEEGAVPHNAGTDDRVLRGGESIVVDVFPRRRLFADCTRTFCVGRAPEPLKRAHEEVKAALSLAYEKVGPGVRGWALQKEVCRFFRDCGHDTPLHSRASTSGYVHGLGHGVGYELHEDPHFRDLAGEAGTLQVGDVFTLEPGLYEPEQGYAVRLEDLVFLGEAGLEVLTELPYDLDPRAWTRSAE